MLLLLLVVVFAIAGVAFLVASHANSLTYYDAIDLAAPNCGQVYAHQIGNHSFGIVGVNNATANFSQNPCLSTEAHLFPSHALYAVGNYPSPYCSSHGWSSANECGRQAAIYAANYAKSKGVWDSRWYIDVETGAGWGSNTYSNRQFLNGMWGGLVSEGANQIGYYSNQSMWKQITGAWWNSSPGWYATGWRSSSDNPSGVTGYCKWKFTYAGNHWVQFIHSYNGVTVDEDVLCR